LIGAWSDLGQAELRPQNGLYVLERGLAGLILILGGLSQQILGDIAHGLMPVVRPGKATARNGG